MAAPTKPKQAIIIVMQCPRGGGGGGGGGGRINTVLACHERFILSARTKVGILFGLPWALIIKLYGHFPVGLLLSHVLKQTNKDSLTGAWTIHYGLVHHQTTPNNR